MLIELGLVDFAGVPSSLLPRCIYNAVENYDVITVLGCKAMQADRPAIIMVWPRPRLSQTRSCADK